MVINESQNMANVDCSITDKNKYSPCVYSRVLRNRAPKFVKRLMNIGDHNSPAIDCPLPINKIVIAISSRKYNTIIIIIIT